MNLNLVPGTLLISLPVYRLILKVERKYVTYMIMTNDMKNKIRRRKKSLIRDWIAQGIIVIPTH